MICVAGTLICITLSAMMANNSMVAFNFLEHKAKIFLPVFIGLTLIKDIKQLRQLAWVIVGSLGFIAYEENISYLRYGINLYNTDNLLAHEMAAGCGVAFFLGVESKSIYKKLLCWALAALMVHTTMFHMSRGAMLGVAVAGVISFWVTPKTIKGLWPFVIAIVCGLMLAGPSVWVEFNSSFSGEEERDASAQSRFDLWRDMVSVANENPLLGIGPDHWPLVASQYGWPAGKEGHGLWFQLVCELGYPGGLMFLGMYLSTVILCYPIARSYRQHSRYQKHLQFANFAAMVVVSLTAFMFEQLFGSFESMEIAYYVMLLGAGVLKLSSTSPNLDYLRAVNSPLPKH